MSQNSKKIKNVKSENIFPVGPERFLKPLLGFGVLVVLLAGLMQLFSSSGNLVPYNEFKKTSAAATDNPDKSNSKQEPKQKAGGESRQAAKPESKQESKSDPKQDKDAGKVILPANPLIPPVGKSATPNSALPKETLEYIAKGMKFVEENKFYQAELEFAEAAKTSPSSKEVYSIWGTALRMEKKFEGADKKFARAHEIDPKDEEILFNWGMSRLLGENVEGAIDIFKKTLALDPNHYMAYNYLGKAFGRKKEYKSEEENYKKSIAINPDFAQAHFNLGVVLSLQKKFQEAVPHYEKAIQLDPEFDKPFVKQFLMAYGKGMQNPNQQAKLAEDKKTGEASDHKGHKTDAPAASDHGPEVTNIKGAVLINGKTPNANTVIFLETKTKLPVPEQKVKSISISQKRLKFEPQHSVVYAGAEITFMNDDFEVHNIYSKSLNNHFNLGAMAGGSSKSIRLKDPGPVILHCNLHKEMIGTIFVVPNGYYTHTNAAGEYAFNNVQSKEYFLQAWNPQLYPVEVEQFKKSIGLTGEDKVYDFNIASQSNEGEIHDLLDETDYNAIVDSMEKEMMQAVDDWKDGKKYLPTKRLLKAITSIFDGEGLKGAIAKSFSESRGEQLETKMDEIRKKVSTAKGEDPKVTEASLKNEIKQVIAQLRNNAQELKARLNPEPASVNQ